MQFSPILKVSNKHFKMCLIIRQVHHTKFIFAPMLDKLQAIKDRWLNIQEELNDPVVIGNQQKYVKLSRDYKELQKIVESYDQYKLIVDNIESSKNILVSEKDSEFRDMARVELDHLEEEKEKLEEHIRRLLIPKDPQDER